MKQHPGHRAADQDRSRSRAVWVAGAILLGVLAVTIVLALLLPGLLENDDGGASGWPTEAWATSRPENQGMDPVKLLEMMAYIDEHRMAVDSVIIVRNGLIVCEEYFGNTHSGTLHSLYSVSKSVTSILVGLALEERAIESLDARVLDLLPGYTGAAPGDRWERMTLEHLLTMSDGIDWDEHSVPYSSAENVTNQMVASAGAVQFVLDRPMAREPGEAWAYNSGATTLLGAIVEESTGSDLIEYARKRLFDPTGIGLARWRKVPGGHYDTGGGLEMTPRDMARLGYLMLRNGEWDGQQVVPAEWVARSTAAAQKTQGPLGYGYQWWVMPNGTGYAAMGIYGQRIYVVPGADLVVVTTASIPDGSLHGVDGLLHGFILPAITDRDTVAASVMYDKNGFAYEYPGRFLLADMPIPGRKGTSDASGMVQLTSYVEPLEIVSLLWDEADGDADERSLLDDYLAALAASGVELVPAEGGDGEANGHPLAYRYSEMVVAGERLPAISAVFVCEQSGRLFGLTYTTAADVAPRELLAVLEEHIAGVTCH